MRYLPPTGVPIDAVPPTAEEIRLAQERREREEANRREIQAERARLYEARQATLTVREDAEREARERPARDFAEILAQRLGPDLPDFADAMRRLEIQTVLKHLQRIVVERARAEATAAAAADREAMQREHRERHERLADEAQWAGLVT